MTNTYHWRSVKTSEIVPNLREVFRVMRADWRNYHIVNILWIYNKKG